MPFANLPFSHLRTGCPVLLVCSARSGNSYQAAQTFAEALADRQGGKPVRTIILSDFEIIPCLDCGLCNQPPNTGPAAYPPDNPARLCPLAARDESAPLFEALLAAPWLALCAPVYFYHLPARLKALLDRCQLFYNARQSGQPFSREMPERRAYVTLLGARTRGEQLFSGSLISLKYALETLRFKLESPLCLYGLEGKDDLAARPDLLRQVREYGQLAARLENAPPFSCSAKNSDGGPLML